ncbi:MAG: hypothetical protein LWX07_00715 [Bacteroidetes bacterium]|nr:hypothetical protein [Bacteroidota bacterium]
MDKILLIKICGVYDFAFFVFHIFFWKLFDWKNDLAKLKPGNRAIMQILNLRLIYIFLLMSAVCFFFAGELASTSLGRFLLAGFFLFWLGRLIEQFIFLRIKSRMVTILTFVFIAGVIMHFLTLI